MKLLVTTALLALAAPLAASAQTVPAPIAAALADPGRPAADKERDAARHPGELLAFAGIKPGDKVADFIMGGGYFTRILAKTVGDKGRVYAYQPAEFIAFRAAYADEQKAAVAGYANVTPLSDSLATVKFAEPLDAIVTVQNWHDLHLKQSPPGFAAAMAKRLYDNLKPGGVLLVVEHDASTDPGDAEPDKLHRIDPAIVKRDFAAAGFVLDAESDVLRNPADDFTKGVFDPSVRGRTDRFMLRFRRP